MLTSEESGPIFLTCCSWERRSSRVNLSLATRSRQPRRFLLVDFGFDLLDEREHVAHAEDARGHAVGIEDVEIGVFFAHADELDRTVDDGLDRQRRAAAGIAIELGQHDAG